jgi:peptidoglycan/LPS O-acetylase OafA/YrhL
VTVNLTCQVSPVVNPPATCSLNPSMVANGSGTPTLTVVTVAPHAQLKSGLKGTLYAIFLPIGMTLLAVKFRSRRKQILCSCLLCLSLAGLVVLTACGGSSSSPGAGGQPGTPPGTYTVTVSATSGSLAHSIPVTLMVR